MSYLKFIKKDNCIDYNDASDKPMFILGMFLLDDVKCSGNNFFREWVNDDRYMGGGGNYSSLEKKGDNIIIMEEWAEEGDPFLEMPRQSFIHILDEWEKVCKEKPQEVLITREGDRFIFNKKL